jgi:hypothetical protein
MHASTIACLTCRNSRTSAWAGAATGLALVYCDSMGSTSPGGGDDYRTPRASGLHVGHICS